MMVGFVQVYRTLGAKSRLEKTSLYSGASFLTSHVSDDMEFSENFSPLRYSDPYLKTPSIIPGDPLQKLCQYCAFHTCEGLDNRISD